MKTDTKRDPCERERYPLANRADIWIMYQEPIEESKYKPVSVATLSFYTDR